MQCAAHYRAGQLDEALTVLERALELRTEGGPAPLELAFLSMTRHRLGELGAARDSLTKLRDLIESLSPDATDPISRSLFEQAVSLIDPRP